MLFEDHYVNLVLYARAANKVYVFYQDLVDKVTNDVVTYF